MYLSSALLAASLGCLGFVCLIAPVWDFTSYQWRHVWVGAYLLVGVAALKLVVDFARVLLFRNRIEIDSEGVHECIRNERRTTYAWHEIVAVRLKPSFFAGTVFLSYRVKVYDGNGERDSTATVSFSELHFPRAQYEKTKALLSPIDVSVLTGMHLEKTAKRLGGSRR